VDIKENNKSKKYSRAQKKVKELKMFYNHLVVYITCSIILFILSYNNILFMNIISPKILNKIEVLKWINWHVFGTQIFWGIAVILHGLSVFVIKIPFIRKWEEKQVQKYMNEFYESKNN